MADLDFDFFGVQLQARIVVPNAGGDATTTPFDPSDSGAPDYIKFIYKTLEQITVDEEMGTIGTIEVTFTPTYEIALDMLKSKYIKVGNILYVRWGYSRSGGQLSPWKSGLIVSPPRVQLGPITRITIVANAWGHALARTTRIAAPDAPKDAQGTLTGTYEAVFKQIIFKVWGFKDADFDASNATDVFKKTNVVPFNCAVQTDYDILRRLAYDSGNDLIISGPSIKVVSMRKKIGLNKPKVTWTLFGQINPKTGDFPMYDFEFQADALFLPQFQKEVFADKVNADDKTPSMAKKTPAVKPGAKGANGAELTTTPQTGGSGPPLRAGSSQGGAANQRPPTRLAEKTDPSIRQGRLPQPGVTSDNKATRDDEIQAKADLQGAFIKATFNVMGVPFVEPSEIVNLRGVGIFDGPYYLTSVSHMIGRGGYDMACEGFNRTSANALEVLNVQQPSGTSISVGSQPAQPTDQPAGAGVGTGTP